MVKTLSRVGNSMALVIDRPILELLNIDADTPLEIKTDGHSLTITPVVDGTVMDHRQMLFAAALKKTNERYQKTLQRLAK